MTKRILIIANGPKEGTNSNLFSALACFLSERHAVELRHNSIRSGTKLAKIISMLICNVQLIARLRGVDLLIVHSYTLQSLFTILAARIRKKKVVVFQWDIYPNSIHGKFLKSRFRRALDKLENCTAQLADVSVVPSEDFLKFVKHRNLRVMPLWPSMPQNRKPLHPEDPVPVYEKVRLAFVGQAGPTRGLDFLISALAQHTNTEFELNIFSSTLQQSLQCASCKNVSIVHRRRMPREELQVEIESMEFGVISLHPGFEQPGFPSKVFDYVGANLPVVYFGPPMESFTSLLTTSGVGFLFPDPPFDWRKHRIDALKNWRASKASFEDAVKLKWCRVEEIL